MLNHINLDLARKRKLSEDQIHNLNCLHAIMDIVIAEAHELGETYTEEEEEIQKHYQEMVEFLEYEMQSGWGFSRDKSYHNHWRRLPQEEE